MDNITHTAVAALATEFIYQKYKSDSDSKNLRRNLHIASALSSNLPDFDLLMYFIDPTNLGYLINHRGHTHTIVGLIAQFFICVSALLGLNSISKKTAATSNFKTFIYVIAFGLCSHLALDFMNSYGVHPFWPIDTNWYYGDFVFIIEPFIWIISSIGLFYIQKKGLFRYLFLTLALAAPLIFYSTGLSSILNNLCIYGFTILIFKDLYHLSDFKIAKSSLISIFGIICFFALQGFYAKKHISRKMSKEGFKIVDIATSPSPGSFFCWNFLVSQSNGQSLETHSGTYSFSNLLLNTCPRLKSKLETSKTITSPKIDNLFFYISYSQDIKNLKQALQSNCRTKAWFTYTRFPFLDKSTLYDLRFTSRKRSSFASININDNATCPPIDSPWTPPRKDLLFSN